MVVDQRAPDTHGALSESEGIAGALVVALELPSSWVVSLAGFLVRGGVLAFLLPIVVLPTPAAIQADLAPLLVPFVFGQPSPGLVSVVVVALVVAVGWLLFGGLVGAWADVVLARAFARMLAAEENAVVGEAARPGALVVPAFAARLLAHLPLAAVLPWGALRIGEAAYRELVVPFEVATPLLVRIVSATPEAVLLVVVGWVLGEAAGGLAVREIVLDGRSPPRAAVRGWTALVRRPVASAKVLLVTTALVAVAVIPGLVASASAWSRLRLALYEGRSGEVLLPLVVFVTLWLGALVLAAVATAGRSAIWTAWWRPSPRRPGPSA